MKKVLSVIIVAVMLVSILAVSASAELYVQTDFTSMESLAASFPAGLFYTEDGLLYGYSEAKCLQSKGEWYTYDTTIEVSFADDELSEAHRSFELWYCNTNLDSYGRFAGTNYMKFVYNIEEQRFYLGCTDLKTEESIRLVEPVDYAIDDNEDHTFGISVSEKRIRCFFDDQLIFDYYDEKDLYLIGLNDEFTIPTPLVFWNEGNFIQIKGVKIGSVGSLFPVDMGAPAETTTRETTTSQKVVEVTDKEGNTVTDDKGEAVTSISIVTEAPGAANTNQGGNVNGSSSTGDIAFVVVAAMVATLGCALIVKKVAVR